MAAVRHYIYRGGGREVIPGDATHVRIDESVTAIPDCLFARHKNIVEVICHGNVKKIESGAFYCCPRLKRVVMLGVGTVEDCAFFRCKCLEYVQCVELWNIGESAFYGCKSLRTIDLTSAREVWSEAFAGCKSLKEVKFCEELHSLHETAFYKCRSLERITLPLRDDLFERFRFDKACLAFRGCKNLRQVHLAEEKILWETVNNLHLEQWRNDMIEVIHSIKHTLPNAPPGIGWEPLRPLDREEKGNLIVGWITLIHHKIMCYKIKHRRILKEAESILQRFVPNEIVGGDILPFLELPSYSFYWEEEYLYQEEEAGGVFL